MEVSRKRLRIGITGGIGSGKSTVCKMFEVLGYPVFYADDEAKRAMTADKDLVANIKLHFGEQAYFENGEINRKLISDIVFHNREKLDLLNSLVHPATLRAYTEWETKQSSAFTFKEAALLFETGTFKLSDYNVLVTAPMELRIKRVMDRDHVSFESVRARMDKQMNDEEKEKLADFIIKNDGITPLIPQVLQFNNHILTLLTADFSGK